MFLNGHKDVRRDCHHGKERQFPRSPGKEGGDLTQIIPFSSKNKQKCLQILKVLFCHKTLLKKKRPVAFC